MAKADAIYDVLKAKPKVAQLQYRCYRACRLRADSGINRNGPRKTVGGYLHRTALILQYLV